MSSHQAAERSCFLPKIWSETAMRLLCRNECPVTRVGGVDSDGLL